MYAPGDHIGEGGRYHLRRLLGRGGMGSVFRADDLQLHRVVAIKVCDEMELHAARRPERFLEEARIMAALRHPNLVRFLDYFSWDGRLHIVQEHVEGRDLARRIGAGSLLGADEGRRLIRQMAEALALLHREGILHRDLKPSNVLETPGGDFKLADFGLSRRLDASRLTLSGDVVGTPRYLPPESFVLDELEEPGPRGDLYQLGIVVAEALAGPRALGGEKDEAIWELLKRKGRLDDDDVPSAVPADLRALIRRCCTWDPRERPADGAALLALVDAREEGTGGAGASEGLPRSVLGDPDGPSEAAAPLVDAPPKAARWRWQRSLSLLVPILSVVAAAAILHRGLHPPRPPRAPSLAPPAAARRDGVSPPFLVQTRPLLDGMELRWPAGRALDVELDVEGEPPRSYTDLRKGRLRHELSVVDRNRTISWKTHQNGRHLDGGRSVAGLRETFHLPSLFVAPRTNRPLQPPLVHGRGFHLSLRFGQVLSFVQTRSSTGTIPVLRAAFRHEDPESLHLVRHESLDSPDAFRLVALHRARRRLVRLVGQAIVSAWDARKDEQAPPPLLDRDLQATEFGPLLPRAIDRVLVARGRSTTLLAWDRPGAAPSEAKAVVEWLRLAPDGDEIIRSLGAGRLLDLSPSPAGEMVLWGAGSPLHLTFLRDSPGTTIDLPLAAGTGPRPRIRGSVDGRDWIASAGAQAVWIHVDDGGRLAARPFVTEGSILGIVPARRERGFLLATASPSPEAPLLGCETRLLRLVLPDDPSYPPLTKAVQPLARLPQSLNRIGTLDHGLVAQGEVLLLHGGDALQIYRRAYRPRLVVRRAFATALYDGPFFVDTTVHCLFHDGLILSAECR